MAVENFTTYTEVDPNGHLSQSATRSTYTGLGRNETAYLYRDMGAGHFSGDFEHLLDSNYASQTHSDSVVYHWGLSLTLDELTPLKKIDLYAYNTTIRLNEYTGTNNYDSGNYTITLGNTYYLKIKRDESVGTYGTLYCYVYTDAARTTLVSTLSVALHEKVDFRYIYSPSSCNTATAYYQTGYIENLDLQEAVAGTNMKINVGDSLKTVSAIKVNVEDTWRTVSGAKININNTWKTIF